MNDTFLSMHIHHLNYQRKLCDLVQSNAHPLRFLPFYLEHRAAHKHLSATSLNPALARSLSFSHTDITSAPLPALWMQRGRDSTQTEWMKPADLSLSPPPLGPGPPAGRRIEGGLQGKVETFFSPAAPGLTQTFLAWLAVRWSHTLGLFLELL